MTRSGRVSGNPPANSRQLIAIALGLVALTWLVFGQTLRFPFISFDDPGYVYQNRTVREGLTWHGVVWAFTHASNANWHPLTMMSHMLDCTLFGLNAGSHHFTNVLLHSVGVVLLFFVLQQLTGATWRSAFVAGLFAIHPLRVESVAWVAERKDVLSGIFFFLTLGAYTRYARSPSLARYAAVAGLFAVGLLCKPMLVTVPIVLLLLDYWPLRRLGTGPEIRRAIMEKLPLVLLSALSSVATVLAQEKTIAAMNRLPMSLRIGNAFVAVMIYVKQMFLPVGLAVLYPHPDKNLPVWEIGLSLTLLLAITILIWINRRKFPCGLTGWFWFLIMLTPVIGIVQVGLQSHADRYTYLPQIGLYMLVTWLVSDWTRNWQRQPLILGATGGMILVALAGAAFVQTTFWRDSMVLWKHTVAVTSSNYTAHAALSALYLKAGDLDQTIEQARLEVAAKSNSDEGYSRLGIALFRQGHREEALEAFRRVERLRPNYPDVHYNIGTVLLEEGRLDEAVAEFEREEQSPQEPGDPNDMTRDVGGDKYRDEALFHINYGAALSRKGRFNEALEQFRRVLDLNQNYPKLHYNIGNIALQQGRLDEARAEYEKELAYQPNDSMTHADLGVIQAGKGDLAGAIEEWKKATDLDPKNLNATCNLAWVLSTNRDAAVRDGSRAVALAEKAVDLSGGTNPRVLRILAAAYAEAGRFGDAINSAEKAEQLAQDQNNAELSATLQKNLEQFRAQQPLRD